MKNHAFWKLLALASVSLLAGCTSMGAVSKVPLDTTLSTITLADATDREKAGVDLDLGRGFTKAPTKVRVNGVDYALELNPGIGSSRQISAPEFLSLNLLKDVTVSVVPKVHAKGSAVAFAVVDELFKPWESVQTGFSSQQETTSQKSGVKVGDWWVVNVGGLNKFGLFEKKVHFVANTVRYELMGFASFQDRRCAILRFTNHFYIHVLMDGQKNTGSAVGVQKLEGVVALDYTTQEVLGVFADGQSNVMGEGGLVVPVNFFTDAAFQEAAATTSVRNVFVGSRGPAVGIQNVLKATPAEFQSKDFANGRIQALFEQLPPELYPRLVQAALGSQVYPKQLDVPLKFQVSMSFQ